MIAELLSDAGFLLSLRWMLAAVFIVGLLHKLQAPAAFVTVLRGYKLLPELLVAGAAYLLIAAEVLTAILLLLNHRFGSAMALSLLSVYTVAIFINIVRGRRDIDCGCAGPAVRQTLSGWLLVRNAAFIFVALWTLSTQAVRSLLLLDWFTALAAATVFAILFTAASQLQR